MFDTGLNTFWSANWVRQSGSQRITELKPTIRKAFAATDRTVVDVIVVLGRTSNLSYLDLDMTGHVAIGKVKDGVLAGTGS